MSRKKLYKKKKLVSLTEEAFTKLEELSKIRELDQSKIVEGLILGTNTDDKQKLKNKSKELEKIRDDYQNKINEINNELNKIDRDIEKLEAWQEERSVEVLEAVDIIKRIILRGNLQHAERYAKSRIDLGINWIDMIQRAKEELEVSGV